MGFIKTRRKKERVLPILNKNNNIKVLVVLRIDLSREYRYVNIHKINIHMFTLDRVLIFREYDVVLFKDDDDDDIKVIKNRFGNYHD